MKKVKSLAGGLAGALAIGAGSAAYGDVVVVNALPPDISPIQLPSLGTISVDWDMNGDGNNDFQFTFYQPQSMTMTDWQAGLFPLAGGNFTFGTPGVSPTLFYAWRFNAGDTIGAVPPTGAVPVGEPSFVDLASRYGGTDYGQFLPPNSRGFLGLEFTTSAGTFFGYIEVQVNRSPAPGQPGFQFFSAAYDNTPGTAITAGAVPEPGTLALLAFGAAGVAAIQRRRKSAKG